MNRASRKLTDGRTDPPPTATGAAGPVFPLVIAEGSNPVTAVGESNPPVAAVSPRDAGNKEATVTVV